MAEPSALASKPKASGRPPPQPMFLEKAGESYSDPSAAAEMAEFLGGKEAARAALEQADDFGGGDDIVDVAIGADRLSASDFDLSGAAELLDDPEDPPMATREDIISRALASDDPQTAQKPVGQMSESTKQFLAAKNEGVPVIQLQMPTGQQPPAKDAKGVKASRPTAKLRPEKPLEQSAVPQEATQPVPAAPAPTPAPAAPAPTPAPATPAPPIIQPIVIPSQTPAQVKTGAVTMPAAPAKPVNPDRIAAREAAAKMPAMNEPQKKPEPAKEAPPADDPDVAAQGEADFEKLLAQLAGNADDVAAREAAPAAAPAIDKIVATKPLPPKQPAAAPALAAPYGKPAAAPAKPVAAMVDADRIVCTMVLRESAQHIFERTYGTSLVTIHADSSIRCAGQKLPESTSQFAARLIINPVTR